MAYSNKFVINILVNNEIISELNNGQLSIPFGSEYKIRLRNRNNRRAVCKLFIDEEDVSGGGFIINANSFVDIERPVHSASKFKFVSTKSIEAQDFGKNRENTDKSLGLIRAEFALEKSEDVVKVIHEHHYHNHQWPYGWRYKTWSSTPPSIGGFSQNEMAFNSKKLKPRSLNVNNTDMVYDSLINSASSAAFGNVGGQNSERTLEDGATVLGSASSQRFVTSSCDVEDNWTVLKVFILGYNHTLGYIQPETASIEVNSKETTELSQEIEKLELLKLQLQKEQLLKEIEQLQKVQS